MNYLLKLIVFTAATLSACMISDIIKIKTERRIGIAKKPLLLFTRYLPGYLNFSPHIAILFIIVIFSSQNMSSSFEYIILPLILAFITKILFIKTEKESIYIEIISIAAILICLLPILLHYNVPSWLCFVAALISVKTFNNSASEILPLNMARNLTLNIYILYIWIPSINFYLCVIAAVIIIYLQNVLSALVPKFNQTKNSKLVFIWTFLISISAFIITSFFKVFLSGGLLLNR